MKSSGMKRGLAVSAVTALALTGVALAPAQAQTIIQGENDTLELYSQVSGDIGVRNDGTNATVTLSAASNMAAVNSFVFTATGTGAPIEIADVAAINGYGTVQWTPPAGVTLEDIDNIRVEAENNADVNLGTVNQAIATTTVANNEVVGLDGVDGAPLGVYDGSATVTGLTTDAPNTSFQIAGPDVAGAAGTAVVVGDPTPNNLTPVAANVAVGANDTGDATDTVIARGTIAGQSDDVQTYDLYDQVVKTATAVNDPAFPSTVQGGSTTQVARYDITVTDQMDAPIAGVDIFESNSAGVNQGGGFFSPGMARDANGNLFDDGETDELGQLEIRLNETDIDGFRDLNPNAGVGTAYLVVDKNQNGAFDNGLDQILALDITNLAQQIDSVSVTSSLGAVIDDDESTNVNVKVVDDNGNPVNAATVTLQRTRNGGTPVTIATGSTNAQGVYAAPVADQPGVDGQKTDVVYTATTGTKTGTLAVETDQANVVWANAPSSQALATTDTTESGTLQLPSGSVLPARDVRLDLNTPGANNALFSPQNEQPAGTIRGGDEIADTKTAANGTFSVKVDDPAAPSGQELDDNLIARFVAGNTPGGSARSDLDIDFLRSVTPTRVNIYRGPASNNDNDGLPSVLGFGGIRPLPGSAALANVKAFNSDGIALTNQDVTVSIDEGFLVNPDDAVEATPAPGAPIDLKSAGKTLTVNTGAGMGLVIANIERSEGFDDDGIVSDKIRASIASASDTHDFDWSTQGVPLNPRATNPLVVELSDTQESSILPKARGGAGASAQGVNYDAMAFDQFGNPVSQDLDVRDNTPLATFTFPNGDDSQYALSQPAIVANATKATDQVLEVELDNAVTTTYADDVATNAFDPANPVASFDVDPVDIEVTTDAINWYEAIVTADSFTLGRTGSGDVPTGSTVSFKLTGTDQEGQPLNGFGAGFLRVGPGSDDNADDGQQTDVTNANGEAFYDFAGGVPGQANVSAVVYNDTNGSRLFVTPTSKVTFVGPVAQPPVAEPDVKADINPKIFVESGRGGADFITVRAKRADGGLIKVFRKTQGGRSQVATKRLGANGSKSFKVKDLNKRRKTRYFAIVLPTDDTNRAKTNQGVTR